MEWLEKCTSVVCAVHMSPCECGGRGVSSFHTGPEEASWPAQTLCRVLVASRGHWSVTLGLGDTFARLGPSLSGDKSNERELVRDEVVGLGTEGDPLEQSMLAMGPADSAEPQKPLES